MRILLSDKPAEGNGNPPAVAAPAAAAVVAGGKTEREILLEQKNAKLVKAVQVTAASKRKAEESAALALRENEQLKQSQQKTVASQKASWMGFTS